MKVSVLRLRELVREAAVTAATVPPDVGLIVREGAGHVSMALVRLAGVDDVLSGRSKNPKASLNLAIIGGISVVKFDVWRVTNVKADKGYGPLLYGLAMQYATQRGSCLSSDPHGSTSPDAQRVWDRFAERSDVEVVFLGDEHGDQRDVGYQLAGDESVDLVERYASLLSRYDRAAVGRLEDLLDEAIGEAVATFG